MQLSILDKIQSPLDLRKVPEIQLPLLAKELRKFIINILATKEGHLGASLGVIELTIALHYIFDTPNDNLIWDVGHQAYGHKILTGRKEIFHTNRQKGGISGFPNRGESPYDTFGTGHSSTSVSAALGMAMAASLKGQKERHHIAVIGDASIASGMAFEGMNHAGVTDANLLIILNDNAIGIDPSVGALKKYLTNVKKGTAREENIFEALNIKYFGPIDGHNLPELTATLEKLKTISGPKFLHVITTKGKGLALAEKEQITYHAPGKFNAITGVRDKESNAPQPPKYQDVFGHTLVELARENKKIIGITPAMPTGSSLKYMIREFPDRAFDVGIAEQHAVTLAAGLATEGMVVFCNIYSTFLQRAYDQVIHDVALQKLPVIFCLDRAGLVGQDGGTHQGVYDLSYLSCIPNLIIYAPSDDRALRNIMYTAQRGLRAPIAIRYPRGRAVHIDWKKPFREIPIGKGSCIQEGENIAIISIGSILKNVLDASAKITAEIGIYDMGFLKPLDTDLLDIIFDNYQHIITIEDGSKIGGMGSMVCDYAFAKAKQHINITVLGIPDMFIEHATVEEQQEEAGISVAKIVSLLENLA
ncbi:1-deoxy-D-xylulose-5-phosphate synthase [Dokdonia sp. Hel_I_53]|uniref:1-deoxy-D-xylulose-5-phosphate synthase n=1 Tax=Dokdonia sp. Hel_I_53 TaxID=1566287 RepID=UPI00119C3668|nr:1-deoxy-D-xylulose-5-phosphate synthase [Dokdonia sp. Hel_I_53]TVZ52298.1 1-deoxy-D-xylulose-5-phosphate synthase [Dokdonia sp. Hel_I_53]